MPQPLSMDLRTRVLTHCDSGMKTKAVAEKFSVSPAWVRRLKQRRRETGEVAPGEGRPGPKPKLADQHDRLREAAERTVEGLWSALGRLLDQFSPDECRNYFRHRGYAATRS
jgi:transposase